MKKWFSLIIIGFFSWGCAATPYIQTIKPVFSPQTGYEEETQYFGKLKNNLEKAARNNDLDLDYWQVVALVPLDRYVILNNELYELINENYKQYNDIFLADYKKILIDGFNRIGKSPNESNLTLMRYEFTLACIGNKYNEMVMNQVFDEIYKKKENIFNPIFNKAKEISGNNVKELSSALQDNSPFVNSYINLVSYAKQEKNKLILMGDIYKEYGRLYEYDKNKLLTTLSDRQKDLIKKFLSSKNNSSYSEFVKSLKNDQIIILDSLYEKWKYREIISQNFNPRIEKLTQLSKWLEENKTEAEKSLQQQDAIRAERAERNKAVVSSLLLGVAGGLASYSAYQASRPRPQNLWLHDSKGNVYWGTLY